MAPAPVTRRDGPGGESSGGTWRSDGHVIVCGLKGVGLRAVEQLHRSGVAVVVVDDDPDLRLARIVEGWGVAHIHRSAHQGDGLAEAGLDRASAVICVETSELATLEIAMRVREARPDVRLVVQLANESVGRALERVTGTGQRARRGRPGRPVVRRGVPAASRPTSSRWAVSSSPWFELTVSDDEGSTPPSGATSGTWPRWRSMPADGGEMACCPGRDHPVAAGDRVAVFGTPDELHRAGIDVAAGRRGRSAGRSRCCCTFGAGCRRSCRPTPRAWSSPWPAWWPCWWCRPWSSTSATSTTPTAVTSDLLASTYFMVETLATVGFGDYSFAAQSAWLQVFAIALIVVGVTLVTTAFALFTNILVSRRIEQSLGRRRVPGMAGHVVVIGLGSVGIRVVEGLLAEGRGVVVVERDDDNRYLDRARALGVPVVIGDATQRQTHTMVNLADASAVAILTSADLTNIETGLAVRESLGRALGGGAGGAAGLRPGPGPHDGAELWLPARPLDVGPRRSLVRRRRPRTRRPRDVLRRPAAVPGRPPLDRPRWRACRVWPCRTFRPVPG